MILKGCEAVKKYYEILISGIPEGLSVREITTGLSWVGAELSDGSFGIAMRTDWHSIERMQPSLVGLGAKKAAECVMSWNLSEASEAMAVINAYYNSRERMDKLGSVVPYETVCTCGLEIEGKTVGFVGHLIMPDETVEGASQVYIMERRDIAGDYPDSACEYLLPECDIVIITGSAAINKTMPRLIELSEKAEIVIIGPSTPMCPELLSAGVSRLSGMIVKDKDEFRAWMTENRGNPYPYGQTFLIK